MPKPPPLVEPDATLSRREITRYSRQLIIPEIRSVGQKRLKNARVLCLGADGLSALISRYLAAAGVGTLGIAEFEHAHAGSWLGSLRPINPHVRLVPHEDGLDPNSSRKLFARYDLVVDGTDDPTTCHVADYACAAVGRPLVWGSARGPQGLASVFWAEHGPRLRDAPSGEGGTGAARAEGGGFRALWASIAAVMATEAIKLITGVGEPLLGRMLVHDALGMEYRTVEIRGHPDFSEPVGEVSPKELKELLDRGDPIDLIDIREPYEWKISAIPGGRRVPMAQWLDGTALSSLSPERRPVFYCRKGNRTVEVVAVARRAGFPDAVHLQGGVNAWANHVDPSLPVY